MFAVGVAGVAKNEPDALVEDSFEVTDQRSLLLSSLAAKGAITGGRVVSADEHSALAICDRELSDSTVGLGAEGGELSKVNALNEREHHEILKSRLGIPFVQTSVPLSQEEFIEVYSPDMPVKVKSHAVMFV